MAKLYDGYSNKEPNDERELITISPVVLKARFLELYMLTANTQKTCRILGLVPRTVYHWKQNDEQFKADWIMADRVALSVLEDEANRRAVYGVEKPVYQGGKLAGFVTEYSDSLLHTLLKARAPEKYKDRFQGQLTGPDGKPLLQDFTINHVHSKIPLAQSEEDIIQSLESEQKKQSDDENTEDIDHEEYP